MKILFLFWMSLISVYGICEKSTIDLANLDSVKHYLTGEWRLMNARNNLKMTITFSGDNYSGTWKSENVISTAPIFNLIRESDSTILLFLDLTGGSADYELILLTGKKAVMLYEGKKMKYARIG